MSPWFACVLFLLSGPAAFAEKPDFGLGIALAIDSSLTEGRNVLRITPHGSLMLRPDAGVESSEIRPRVSFVVDDSGRFHRVEVEVENSVVVRSRVPGIKDISILPRVIVTQAGQVWMFIPKSFLPHVQGVGADSLAGIGGLARGAAAKPDAVPIPLPEPPPYRFAAVPYAAGTVAGPLAEPLEPVDFHYRGAPRLRLTMPAYKAPSYAKAQDDYVLKLRSRWAQYLAEHPDEIPKTKD